VSRDECCSPCVATCFVATGVLRHVAISHSGSMSLHPVVCQRGVAPKFLGLFRKRNLSWKGSFAKETYDFKVTVATRRWQGKGMFVKATQKVTCKGDSESDM